MVITLDRLREYRKRAEAKRRGTRKEWKREWVKKNKEHVKQYSKNYEKTYYLREEARRRRVARQELNYAIRIGKVKREKCRVCGKKAMAHHDDYSKSLDVIWLCSEHHHELHFKLNTKD